MICCSTSLPEVIIKLLEIGKEGLGCAVEIEFACDMGDWGRLVRRGEERDRLLKTYFPARTDVVLEHLRKAGFFHRFDAPAFNVHGGEVESGFQVEIQSEGQLFYTLDGTDPRLSDTRFQYQTPITIDGPTVIHARSRVHDTWSALVVAEFASAVMGDFSNDGVLDGDDIDLLFAAIRENSDEQAFDLDRLGRLRRGF